MEKNVEKKQKVCFVIMVLALLAYVIKNIFVGADVDEGYGVMVGYRLATGDKLLSEMWEPHQTSAIFTALFIRPFLWLTKGNLNFLNIYLRVIYFILHGGMAVFAYHTFRKCKPDIGKYAAAGLALVCFVCSPKSIFIPEYSNLHILFLVLLCLVLMWYFCAQSSRRGQLCVLAAAGLCLTCDVLAYPSMALLLPFCLVVMARKRVNSFWKEALCFVLPCVISAGILLGYVLSYMSLEEIVQVIPHVLGDGSHQMGFVEKATIYLQKTAVMGLELVTCAVVAWLMTIVYVRVQKKKGAEKDFVSSFLLFFFFANILYMFYIWLTHEYNAGYTRMLYIGMAITGVYCYVKTGKKENTGFYLILISIVNYCAVILLSNWDPTLLTPYMITGAVGGFLCWNVYFKEYGVKIAKGMLSVLCGVLVFSCCFGYCFRIIGGDLTPSTIFEIRGICRDGFLKGVLANYMTAYRYNANQEIWAEIVPEGSSVMYVGMSQFSYMHGDCVVAVPSTISTPTYDETLLAYWEMNPDRYPDIVIMESTYGDIGAAAQDEFLLQWLEEDFKAKEITDYPYMRVYRR